MTSEGTNVTQTFIRVGPSFSATAIATGDFQTYEEELAPRGQGWEYVESLDMRGNAERWASIAAEKLTAKSVEAGPVRSDSRSDEPVADDSRIDRPPDRARSRGRPGSELRRHQLRGAAGENDRQAEVRPGVHERAGRSHAGGLALARGVGRRRSARGPVADHREGHFQGLPDDARAGEVDSAPHRRARGRTAARSPSRGTPCSFSGCRTSRCCPASATSRSTTSSRRPTAASSSRTAARGRSTISATTSSSRDRSYYEVRNGKIAGMLRDVAYQSNTPVFWNSMDMIGGKSSYWLGGSFNDGKGEPSQVELGEPRMPAMPIPQRHDPQHGTESHDRATRPRCARRSRAGAQQGAPIRRGSISSAPGAATRALPTRASRRPAAITDVVVDGDGHDRPAACFCIDQRAR